MHACILVMHMNYQIIYSCQLAIESVVMPQIKQKVIKFIESSDEDQWLHQQSIKYADITLDQLGYVTCVGMPPSTL